MSDVEDATKKEIGKDKDASVSIAGHYRRTDAPAIQPLAVEMGFSIPLEPDEEQSDYLPVIGFVDSYAVVPDSRPGPTKGQPIIALEDYKKSGKRNGTRSMTNTTPRLAKWSPGWCSGTKEGRQQSR